MANEENLNPIRSESEARELGRKGGIASGKARREKKLIREMLEEYLAMPVTINGEKRTRKDAMVLNAVKIVSEGTERPSDFMRAFEVVRDTLGEAPVQRVEVDTIDPETRSRVESILSEN